MGASPRVEGSEKQGPETPTIACSERVKAACLDL